MMISDVDAVRLAQSILDADPARKQAAYAAILPEVAREYLGPFLGSLLLQQSDANELVRQADRVSASRDRARYLGVPFMKT